MSWHPLGTRYQNRLTDGDLIAYLHAVWRVVEVRNAPLGDDDHETWLRHGMPDLDKWSGRPYTVTADWIGGALSPWAEKGDYRRRGTLRIAAGACTSWRVYPDGRWPQCSCCGEPMPCRAELEDREVTGSLDRVAHLEAIPPGACWACAEPITIRQKSVTYPGENLLLPGAHHPQFHTRGKCWPSAHGYEEKWLAADPRRERILTWPWCDGILVVHGDGSSECVSGRNPVGRMCESQPDCRGHLTHDHGTHRACYVAEHYFSGTEWPRDACPRGCGRKNHPGTTTTPRPERRQPSAQTVQPEINP